MSVKRVYFCEGYNPTDKEIAEAKDLGIPPKAFRNASRIVSGEALEPFEVVAGKVPEVYIKLPGCKVLTKGK